MSATPLHILPTKSASGRCSRDPTAKDPAMQHHVSPKSPFTVDCLQSINCRSGEIAQQLRTLAVFPDNSDLIPSTHKAPHNYL